MDLDVVEILLPIGPVGTLSDFRGEFPADAQSPILVIIRVGRKTVALQHGYIHGHGKSGEYWHRGWFPDCEEPCGSSGPDKHCICYL